MTITGNVRLGKKTKQLVPSLLPGEIAVIDHEDIDRVSAEGLLDAGVKAVVNAAVSATGNYPNSAPEMLLDAKVPVIDSVGPDIFEKLEDGETVKIDGADIYKGEEIVASGKLLTREYLEERNEAARGKMGENLEEFVVNTAEYLKRDKGRIVYNSNPPKIDTKISGKQVLVVVRGPDYKEDLITLRSYISEVKPAIIAVDGAADALLDAGLSPDIIVGDMDSVTDNTLKCGAEIIAHAYENGECPSGERLDSLGVEWKVWSVSATSEDLAMLLAWENDADLIVAVGTHSNLIEYMEKNRKGMASTFLVRLLVGTKLVDAKGVSKLYRPSPPGKYVLLVILCALIAILVAVFISEPLRNTLIVVWLTLRTTLGF
ncbi:MAG: putative cytokinetic ring protein SteA [Coriobacteriales bacterium]|jgi:uncharacterized membrane-anchored protein